MPKQKLIIAIIILIVLGGAFYYGWFGQKPFNFFQGKQPEKYTGPVEKINFSSSPGVKNAAVYIAKSKGYFQQEGLDVDIIQVPTAKLAFLHMLNGEGVDIAALADTPITLTAFERKDFYILATISEGHDEKIVARKDRGINVVRDLKGKKVGLAGKGIGNHYFLSSLLTFHGLTGTDVEIIVMDPEKLLPALGSGTLDAIAVVEPDAFLATQLLGNNSVVFPNQGIYQKTFDVVVKDNFAHNHPETLVRFLRAIDKANKFIAGNEEESQTIVAEVLKLAKKDIVAIWNENSKIISLDQSFILTLENEARWAIKNKLTDQTTVPNYLNFIYFDALAAVKPEAITIIH